LKAGGAYVPLDPTYPRDRIAFMIADAELTAIVTETPLASELTAPGTAMVLLDALEQPLTKESDGVASRKASGEDVAYMIYTSGSPGKPRGVQIPHRAVVNFMHAMQKRPGIDETDRLLAVTSLSFDIAGLEIFLPLSVGARIELVTSQTAMDGAALLARMA